MGARRGRRFFLGAITLLGAGLIAIAYVVQLRESQRRSAPAPEPAWRSADRSVAFLQHQLRPRATGDSIATARIVACVRASKPLDSTTDPLRVRMIRSLNSGHEFDSEIVLTCRAVETGQDLELNVTRGGQEPFRLRLQVRAGVIAAIQQAVASPSTWQPWTGARDLPLALGDLQVDEVLELCRAFAAGEFTPLGYLDGMGARPQLVLETKLAPRQRTSPESGEHIDTPAAGERALAYVDSATCDLRGVRVLDAKGYVVRVYENMVWEMSGSRPRLSELQVTSMPSSSHTVFHRVVEPHEAVEPSSALQHR
jgi:hypothetical protein